MKVLDVHGLHGAVDEIINELNRKNDQMNNIRHSIPTEMVLCTIRRSRENQFQKWK
jgi:hypothetical protein